VLSRSEPAQHSALKVRSERDRFVDDREVEPGFAVSHTVTSAGRTIAGRSSVLLSDDHVSGCRAIACCCNAQRPRLLPLTLAEEIELAQVVGALPNNA
jgi:hypothetical protein